MTPEADAFDQAYGRLAATRLAAGQSGAEDRANEDQHGDGAQPRASGSSSLLPRLALMRPKTPRRQPTWHLE